MNEEKAVREWLETLPDGYRERALKNYDPEHRDRNTANSLPDAISGAFSWKDSPERYRFWSDVTFWAYGHGELPPLPEGGKMNKERLVTRKEVGKLILIRFKGRIEEALVRSVSPNGKFMKVNFGHESVWLDIGDYPIWDILPDTKWVLDLCGLPEEEK